MNRHLLRAIIPLAVAAVMIVGAAAYIIADVPPAPIMKCDPQMLTAGIPPTDIRTICGAPDKITDRSREWYPLHGDRRDKRPMAVTWHYGDVLDEKKHVNLYFENNKLTSVQVFGDYK